SSGRGWFTNFWRDEPKIWTRGRASVAKAITLWVSSPPRAWHPRCVLPLHAPNPAAEEAESFLHAALYAPEPFASVCYLRRACHSPRRAPPVKAETISASHKESLRSEDHTSELQSQSNLVCRL